MLSRGKAEAAAQAKTHGPHEDSMIVRIDNVKQAAYLINDNGMVVKRFPDVGGIEQAKAFAVENEVTIETIEPDSQGLTDG